jgi:hypothetical protein
LGLFLSVLFLPNHGQKHFEWDWGVDCVGDAGRHNHDLAGIGCYFSAADDKFRCTLDYLHEGIIGRGVLT